MNKQTLLNEIKNNLYVHVNLDSSTFINQAPQYWAGQIQSAVNSAIKEAVIEAVEIILENSVTEEELYESFEKAAQLKS